MTTQLKVGDLVRLPGNSKGNSTAFKQGRVVEVIGFDEDYPGQLTVRATLRNSKELRQWLSGHHVKPAKQAMRKRDEYANRWG